MPSETVLEFRNVRYEVNHQVILDAFSLRVSAGETIVLLGRSGSGKTTALRLINGMLMPTSGDVLVEGKRTSDWPSVELKRRIGYVIQEGGLFPHLTISRNVGLVPSLEKWPAEKISARVEELLNLVSLPLKDFGERRPGQLSGGQRQRVGVARALAADPKILLFDEPFGALDPVTRLDLQKEFLRLRAEFGKTSVFVTHDVNEATKLATRIALLAGGKLVFLGTPEEFRQSEETEAKAFLEVLQNAQ